MGTTGIGPTGETGDTPRHRALGSASRVAMLHLLRRSAGPLTARQVADATGLHLTTVKEHLDRLTDAGLLDRDRAADGTPGRPAWRYSPAPDPDPDTGAEPNAGPYRQMATALVEHLVRTEDDPGAVARSVGEAWGRDMAAGADRRARPRSGTSAADTVVDLLDDLGFAPRRLATDPNEVHLHACPFLDLALRHPNVICGLHAGVVRGALDGLGAQDTPAQVEPFGAPTACVLKISSATGD